MKWHLMTGWLVLAAAAARGQVNNDNVASRIHLETDALPVHTTTASSTVEWDCLNQALTQKCLVYHNDQWYSFQVNEPQSYFLNISGLSCRNTNGIQIIIIEGNPCETRNYRVLQCIPQIKNEEVFVPLGIVAANTTYLVEIDGFNGDHCNFDIQVGRRPYGLPMKFEVGEMPEAGIRAAIQKDSIVSISWKVPVSWLEQIDQFRIYRLAEKDIIRLERVLPVSRNAYGRMSDTYRLQDTLASSGEYRYRVYGYPQQDQPILLKEVHISYYRAKGPSSPPYQQIVINPQFSQKVEYAVRVYEAQQLSLLQAFSGAYDPTHPEPITIDMREFITGGHRAYMVVIVNKATRETMELYYRVNERGSIVKE